MFQHAFKTLQATTAVCCAHLGAQFALVPCPCQTPAEALASPTPPLLVRQTRLPEAIASFGACAVGRHLYVYGGHTGRIHAHSRQNLTGALRRLDLDDPEGRWHELPAGPPLQGTALVPGPDGRLYRLGGMAARNDANTDEDLHSTAEVAVFDPAQNTWHAETPLPEPRSSHDAVVVGSRLFVVGGWHLHGAADGDWHTTAWVADLREQPLRWQPLPAPTEPRRAHALVASGEHLLLLGGFGADGVLASVDVLAPGAVAWQAGPSLPSPTMGAAAAAIDGRVFATDGAGQVLAWTNDGRWHPVAGLEQPRAFHRLVAAGSDQLLAIGGAYRSGQTTRVELVPLDRPAAWQVLEHRIQAPETLHSRQALLPRSDGLWLFGGHRGRPGDRFAAGQLATGIWCLDWATLEVRSVGQLDTGRQSLAVANGTGSGDLLLGGLVADPTGAVRSSNAVFRWQAGNHSLAVLGHLPAARTQCQAVQRDGQLWVFGGTDFEPDADGGRERGDSCAVLRGDLHTTPPTFTAASLRLPRPRRSFALATLGDDVVLLGGLGHDFAPAGPADVLDWPSRTWRELPLPRPWVSPQAAVLGERIYVACGGTMTGQRFAEDRSLWSWQKTTGWQCEVAELPFAVRHVQMFAHAGRLWFYGLEQQTDGSACILLRSLVPAAATRGGA